MRVSFGRGAVRGGGMAVRGCVCVSRWRLVAWSLCRDAMCIRCGPCRLWCARRVATGECVRLRAWMGRALGIGGLCSGGRRIGSCLAVGIRLAPSLVRESVCCSPMPCVRVPSSWAAALRVWVSVCVVGAVRAVGERDALPLGCFTPCGVHSAPVSHVPPSVIRGELVGTGCGCVVPAPCWVVPRRVPGGPR